MATQAHSNEADEALHASPRFDFDDWYSTLISFVFHFCVGLLLPLLAGALTPTPLEPVAVKPVKVVDSPNAATGDQNDDLDGGDAAAQATENTEDVPEEQAVTETVNEVAPVDAPKVDRTALDGQSVDTVVNRSSDIASQVRNNLNQRLKRSGGGDGGQGSAGSGTGDGGGRPGRAARWVLRYNTFSPVDYLNQIGSLGGEVAFPMQGNRFKYFTNLQGTPRSMVRDLSGENRIFWIDERADSFLPVARHLGVRQPPLMLSFLPTELEERLLRMELARASEKLGRPAKEGDVAQTVFDVVPRAGEYDVQISEQQLR